MVFVYEFHGDYWMGGLEGGCFADAVSCGFSKVGVGGVVGVEGMCGLTMRMLRIQWSLISDGMGGCWVEVRLATRGSMLAV